MTKRLTLRLILKALPHVFYAAAKVLPAVAKHIADADCVIQLRLRDGSLSRSITFRNGKVKGAWGRHSAPDAEIIFMDEATALKTLQLNTDYAFFIDSLKNFKVTQAGDDAVLLWFGKLGDLLSTTLMKRGTKMPDGTMRYTNLTNGGPLFVYVRDGKIIRTTPIDLDDEDAESYEVEARGNKFRPRRQSTVSPHALGMKSQVYSDKRILYPMKRVDFDPNGERNPQNRGISGYERISWDEAFEIVANEIKVSAVKTTHLPLTVLRHFF